LQGDPEVKPAVQEARLALRDRFELAEVGAPIPGQPLQDGIDRQPDAEGEAQDRGAPAEPSRID
jgi:hypothetical protein